MLTSRMTVDEEEAVQKELEQLQSEALGNVVRPGFRTTTMTLTDNPGSHSQSMSQLAKTKWCYPKSLPRSQLVGRS